MFLLFSLRSILDPFLLFVLLVLHVSPYAGTGSHLLGVTASALIPLAVLMKLLLRMALARYESARLLPGNASPLDPAALRERR